MIQAVGLMEVTMILLLKYSNSNCFLLFHASKMDFVRVWKEEIRWSGSLCHTSGTNSAQFNLATIGEIISVCVHVCVCEREGESL